MRALILIGGKGTRLRPFTCETPKPLLPVVNRPFIEYQLRMLRSHGVREAVLCTSYLPESFRRSLGDGRRLGLRLSYSHEPTPLGTGGAIRRAAPAPAATLLVLNGDVLSALDVRAFLRFHRRHRAEVSITLTRVKDPTAYGLVETDAAGRVRRFLEKPSWEEIRTNTINAGAYLMEPSAVAAIPDGVEYSVERGLFPQLLRERRRVCGLVTPGYWIDIGTLDKYLQVHLDILGGAAGAALSGFKTRAVRGPGVRVGRDVVWGGEGSRTVLGAGTRIGDFARFAGLVCVGAGARVGRGAILEDCVVLDGAVIGDGASLRRCIVGARCRVGAHASLAPGAALGGGSAVGSFSVL